VKDPRAYSDSCFATPSDSSVSESDLSDDDLNDDDDDLDVDKQSEEEEEEQLKKTTASGKENLLLPADEYGQNLGQATLRGKKRKAAWKDEADSEVRVKDVTKNFR
jgi:hypothetical protein